MNLETQLREHFRDEFNTLVPSSYLAGNARLRGSRIRRRRAIAVTGLGVIVLALVTGGVFATVGHGQNTAQLQSEPTATVDPANPIGSYVAQWQRGDFESIRAKMTPVTRSAISADAISSVFGESGAGSFIGITREVTVGPMNQATLSWQHRTAYLTVINSSAGITGLVIYDEPATTPLAFDALPAAQARLGSVLADQVAGRFTAVEAMLSPATAAQLPTSTLASSWAQILATFGTVRGFIPGTLSGPEATNGASVLRGDILLTGGRLTETLAYDDSGKLIGITFTLPALH